MNNSYTDIMEQRDLKVSHQRVRILDFLTNNPCHPTADTVLQEMKKEMPTLSKSTVYKTLKAFVDAGILRELTIEDNEVRYEYNLLDHGHFKCRECGEIYDFTYMFDSDSAEDLKGFRIDDKNIYFKGVCRECLKYSDDPSEEG